METIFELCYRTEKGNSYNLLFRSFDKANQYVDSFYAIGRVSPADSSVIVNSFIVERHLF